MSMGQRTNLSPQQAFIFLYLDLRILTGCFCLDHYVTVKKVFRTDLTSLLVLNCFLLPATRLLSRPSPRMTKGNLIGYTTGGLPIYNFQTPQSVLTTVQSLLRQIVEQSESRQIFYFLCLNLVSSKFCKFLCSVGLVCLLLSVRKFFPLRLFSFWITLQKFYLFFSMPNYIECSDS